MSLFTKKDTTQAIAYSTHCKLCNGKKVAEHLPLDLPIIGEPGKLAKNMQVKQLEHIATRHPDDMKKGAAFLDAVMSFCILNAFEDTDPSVRPRLEAIRASIFQSVRKNFLSDADLLEITVNLGLDPDDAEKVTRTLQAVRDVLTETGQHAPANLPAPSPLVLTR